MGALQSIEDVEDTKDGATMHLQELSELIDQVRANIEAIHGDSLLWLLVKSCLRPHTL